MLMNRDKEVLDFIEKFKIVSTSTLAELFFSSLRMAQYRLRYLAENKVLSRSREYVVKEYLYYIKKPKHVRHSLLLSEFYKHLNRIVDIQKCRIEVNISNILRADAAIGYEYKGNKKLALVEIEISNNKIRNKVDNYRKLFLSEEWKKYFPLFPQIIIVSDKKVPHCGEFQIIQIKEDFSNIEDIISKD